MFDAMKPDESALQVRGLTKRFDRLAVDALDLTDRTGAFDRGLGPNGACTPTTCRMGAGLRRPDAGTVRVLERRADSTMLVLHEETSGESDEPMIYDKLTP